MKTTLWIMTVGLCLTGAAHANDTCRMDITQKDQGGVQYALINCCQSADEPSKPLSVGEAKEYLAKANYELMSGSHSSASSPETDTNSNSRSIPDPMSSSSGYGH